jgi:hypothetical protein
VGSLLRRLMLVDDEADDTEGHGVAGASAARSNAGGTGGTAWCPTCQKTFERAKGAFLTRVLVGPAQR